jgi:hypothetical protein
MRYLDLHKHKLALGATALGTHNARAEVMCPVIFPANRKLWCSLTLTLFVKVALAIKPCTQDPSTAFEENIENGAIGLSQI